MARRCYRLSLASTLIALLLELLHKARRDLLFYNGHSLSIALSTGFDVFRVVTAATSAVWADNLAVVRDIERLAFVELLQGELDLNIDSRPSLLLLLTKSGV